MEVRLLTDKELVYQYENDIPLLASGIKDTIRIELEKEIKRRALKSVIDDWINKVKRGNNED